MRFSKTLPTLGCLVASALAAPCTNPPPGSYVVGQGGNYTTIQSAVNAIPASKAGEVVIFIKPGTYNEQVVIQKTTVKVTIRGYTTDDQDHNKNQVTLTHNIASDHEAAGGASGTLCVKSDNFKLYNVNVANTCSTGAPSMAVSAYGHANGFYGCKFTGHQETVHVPTGQSVFRKCHVQSATDCISSQTSKAWFDGCDISIASHGYVVASGRAKTDKGCLVLNKCKVTGEQGAAAGQCYLGRSSNQQARVAIQNCELGSVINKDRWNDLGKAVASLDSLVLGEFGNTGPGANGPRVKSGSELKTPLTIQAVFGATAWIDMSYWSAAGAN